MSASEKLIILAYVIFSSGLILSPFLIFGRLKFKKWLYIFLSYFLSIIIFLGVQLLDNWFDRYLYNDVYNSGWLMECLLQASFYQWFFIYILFILLPFFITIIKYGHFTVKRAILSTLIALLTAILLFSVWIYYIGWSVSQIGWLYF
jgi:hypothetical protein